MQETASEFLRIFGANVVTQPAELCIQRSFGNSGTDAGNQVYEKHRAAGHARALRGLVHSHGAPDLSAMGKIEALRHDADDGV